MVIYTYCNYANNTDDIANVCLRDYCIKRGECDCTGLKLYHSERGAPYVLDRFGIKISISHSKQYLVIAISSSAVGIDIEYVKDRAFEAISRKFLDKDITNIQDFYTEWTRYEAKYKLNSEDGDFSTFNIFEECILSVISTDEEIIFRPYESLMEEKYDFRCN